MLENKEWLFSGLGIFILGLLGRYYFKTRQLTTSQTLKSGKNSNNFQAGRNINIQKNPKVIDAEED